MSYPSGLGEVSSLSGGWGRWEANEDHYIFDGFPVGAWGGGGGG